MAAPSNAQSHTRTAITSLGVAAVVIGIKYAAYALTGSLALLSDALESLVNVVSALATLWAIHLSHQPPDAEHPYGHHKAEYLSAVVVGVLIILAALLIFEQAWHGFQAPAPLEAPALGLAVNGLAGAVNMAWAWWLIRCGRRWKSPALKADGEHLKADVITSVGVLAGLVLATITGWWWLDPLMAALVACNILWSGSNVIIESADNLMDRAVSPATARKIKHILSEHAKGALEIHDLKTRQAGRATFIEFHLVVPGSLSVTEAHSLCDKLEAALAEAIPGSHITIHTEPEGEARHTGVLVL